jgi:hypothetical protein
MWLGIVRINLWDSPLVLLLVTIVLLNVNEATRTRSSSIQAVYTGIYLWNYFQFFSEFFILIWGRTGGRVNGAYPSVWFKRLKNKFKSCAKTYKSFSLLVGRFVTGFNILQTKRSPGHIQSNVKLMFGYKQ